jgi:hypothetical protein
MKKPVGIDALTRTSFLGVLAGASGGVKQDMVLIRGFGHVDVDFTADQPGLTRVHCH